MHAICEKVFHLPHHVILIFCGDFQTSTLFSTYSVKTESTCWDVRPDTCENGFISTVKECLQFAVFGKRNNFCCNEQTCPGAQWNTGDKFIHNRRGWASCSSRFYDSYELPWGELESLWAWTEPVSHVFPPLKHGGPQMRSTQLIPEESAAHRAEVLRQSLKAAYRQLSFMATCQYLRGLLAANDHWFPLSWAKRVCPPTTCLRWGTK